MSQKTPLNQILYGPPGTGKTYSIKDKIKEILRAEGDWEEWKNSENLIKDLEEKDRLAFTTFHPAYGYEEFMEGIRPNLDGQTISYHIHDGVFNELCQNAKSNLSFSVDEIIKNYINSFGEDEKREFKTPSKNKKFTIKVIEGKICCKPESSSPEREDKNLTSGIKRYFKGKGKNSYQPSYTPVVADDVLKHAGIKDFNNGENSSKPYFMIIDEINRGNIPKIFGELITLIEDTKRAGTPEEISCTLPYSGEPFSVPENVYIIGTMNTADKSLVSLDIALRRRFVFEEMMPLPKLLYENEYLSGLGDMLSKINRRIEQRSHKIGHAFFIKNETIADVKHALQYKVIPLLQEYEYDDWGKIGKILDIEITEPINFGTVADDVIEKYGITEKNDTQEIFNPSLQPVLPEITPPNEQQSTDYKKTIKKLKKRIPKWMREQKQDIKASVIFRCFLEMRDEQGRTRKSALQSKCIQKQAFSNDKSSGETNVPEDTRIEKFNRSLGFMKTNSGNATGKVFIEQGDYLELSQEAKDILNNSPKDT